MPSLHDSSLRGREFQLPGQYGESGKYGRMFPELPSLFSLETLCETQKVIAAFDELGKAMLETFEMSESEKGDNEKIPAGYTYLGQFIDHDLTFDLTSLGEMIVDPLALRNYRTPRFDLDNLYGAGPMVQPYLYQRNSSDQEPVLFEIGQTKPVLPWNESNPNYLSSFPNDLPRSHNGLALISDPRNDENLIIAQLHLAFLKFHNKVAKKLHSNKELRKTITCEFKTSVKDNFKIVRKTVLWHYQWIVLYDYLPKVTKYSKEEIEQLVKNNSRIYKYTEKPFIPVEFSVAAFRFGHSMLRGAYNYNSIFSNPKNEHKRIKIHDLLAFTGSPGNFRVPISSNWIIDWRRFFDFKSETVKPNPSRNINPFLPDLFPSRDRKPINLAAKDLQRGMMVSLPSGQSVANFLGIEPLSETEIATGTDGEIAAKFGFHCETPLWYYILKEAEKKEEGRCLGDVGSRILVEVFIGLLEGDSDTFLVQNKNWKPTLSKTGNFTMVDMLNYVDDINPIDP